MTNLESKPVNPKQPKDKLREQLKNQIYEVIFHIMSPKSNWPQSIEKHQKDSWKTADHILSLLEPEVSPEPTPISEIYGLAGDVLENEKFLMNKINELVREVNKRGKNDCNR